MPGNVFFHLKGLEIKIIDLLTIDLGATVFPWAKATSASRSFPMICAGVLRFLPISLPPFEIGLLLENWTIHNERFLLR